MVFETFFGISHPENWGRWSHFDVHIFLRWGGSTIFFVHSKFLVKWSPRLGNSVLLVTFFRWIGCFRKYWYPKSSIFNRGFNYKPSVLGYPYFWKHPIGDLFKRHFVTDESSPIPTSAWGCAMVSGTLVFSNCQKGKGSLPWSFATCCWRFQGFRIYIPYRIRMHGIFTPTWMVGFFMEDVCR